MRSDLRSPRETRPFVVVFGGIAEADGSAQLTQGGTVIMTSVFGPTHSRFSRLEDPELLSIDLDIDGFGVGAEQPQDKARLHNLKSVLSQIVTNCVNLHHYPRLCLYFKVIMINNEGSCTSVIVNSCILALLDAGFIMKSIPCVVSVAVTLEQTLLLDPTSTEERECASLFNLVVCECNGVDDCVSVQMVTGQGSFEFELYKEASELAVITASALIPTMRKLIVSKITFS